MKKSPLIIACLEINRYWLDKQYSVGIRIQCYSWEKNEVKQPLDSLITFLLLYEYMRGRIASFAVGAAIAKKRTASAMAGQAEQAQQQAQKTQLELEQLKAAQA